MNCIHIYVRTCYSTYNNMRTLYMCVYICIICTYMYVWYYNINTIPNYYPEAYPLHVYIVTFVIVLCIYLCAYMRMYMFIGLVTPILKVPLVWATRQVEFYQLLPTATPRVRRLPSTGPYQLSGLSSLMCVYYYRKINVQNLQCISVHTYQYW